MGALAPRSSRSRYRPDMATRRASCSCEQLTVEVEGDPVRVSICHCLACQRRTGSVFGMQARWPREQVRIEGDATEYVRISDEGEERSLFFCPRCGATVYYWTDPEHIAVPVGAFADPNFPAPRVSVWEDRSTRGSACPTGSTTSTELGVHDLIVAASRRSRRRSRSVRSTPWSPSRALLRPSRLRLRASKESTCWKSQPNSSASSARCLPCYATGAVTDFSYEREPPGYSKTPCEASHRIVRNQVSAPKAPAATVPSTASPTRRSSKRAPTTARSAGSAMKRIRTWRHHRRRAFRRPPPTIR